MVGGLLITSSLSSLNHHCYDVPRIVEPRIRDVSEQLVNQIIGDVPDSGTLLTNIFQVNV